MLRRNIHSLIRFGEEQQMEHPMPEFVFVAVIAILSVASVVARVAIGRSDLPRFSTGE